MTGREFVSALEREGFFIKRRCKSFVWIARGEQTLMVEEDATVPDGLLEQLLGPRQARPSRAPGGLANVTHLIPSARKA